MRSMHFSTNTDAKINWKIVLLIIPYLLEYRLRIAIALLCLVLTKVASVIGPFLLKYIVDDLEAQKGMDVALVAVPLALVLAYGLARFSNVLLGEIRDTVFGRVTERAMRRLGLRVFRHLHALDLGFHLDRRTGGLSRDIDRGTNGISFLMRFFVFNIAPTFLEIAMVIGIFWYNYGLAFAAITLSSVGIYVAYSIKATQWRTQFVREANQADSASSTRAIDSLLNYETVKYFTNEEFEAQRYDAELHRWELARRKNRLSLFALNGGQALIIATAMTSMMALAAWQVTQGLMTLGDFVLVNAFMLQLFLPLNFLGFVYREIKGSMANIEQMFELLKRQPKVVDDEDAVELKVEAGRIEFNKLSFAYEEQRPILKDVSFTIAPGEKVAVVGASGAGKSTLVKLLFRFYQAQGGAICIDGQDIARVSQDSLRAHIGIVPQDTVLFNDSLFENVRYGNPNASDEEVDEAIRLAHLADFVAELPKGSASIVGERGLKLSGGEKQRVAIARTLLKRPSILVFDEATSSLDSESEKAILSAIAEISTDRSSLVIAHRLSTVVDADRIVVLEQGNVVEQGNHQALLEHQGVYAKLWAIQQEQRLS